MCKLITAIEAKQKVAGSEERKLELIKKINSVIISQSERGLRWAHFPSDMSIEEKKIMTDLLIENGFSVKESGHPAINW